MHIGKLLKTFSERLEGVRKDKVRTEELSQLQRAIGVNELTILSSIDSVIISDEITADYTSICVEVLILFRLSLFMNDLTMEDVCEMLRVVTDFSPPGNVTDTHLMISFMRLLRHDLES